MPISICVAEAENTSVVVLAKIFEPVITTFDPEIASPFTSRVPPN